MKLTYYGHSCFGIAIGAINLLVDPFISANRLAEQIDIDAIPADYILLTHGHADHVLDVERIAKRTKAKVIANYEICTWFEKLGLEAHPMNYGGSWQFNFGTVKMVYAAHSSMLPDGSYGGGAAGFVLQTEAATLYIAGDTALTWDMKLIPVTSPKLTAAILPIGDNFTMSAQDAIIAADFIECDTIIGCHYDTFPYIQINKKNVMQLFEKRNKHLTLLEIGGSLTL